MPIHDAGGAGASSVSLWPRGLDKGVKRATKNVISWDFYGKISKCPQFLKNVKFLWKLWEFCMITLNISMETCFVCAVNSRAACLCLGFQPGDRQTNCKTHNFGRFHLAFSEEYMLHEDWKHFMLCCPLLHGKNRKKLKKGLPFNHKLSFLETWDPQYFLPSPKVSTIWVLQEETTNWACLMALRCIPHYTSHLWTLIWKFCVVVALGFVEK